LDRIEKLRAQASSDAGGLGVVGSGVGSGGTDAPGFADKVRKFIRPKITFNAASVTGKSCGNGQCGTCAGWQNDWARGSSIKWCGRLDTAALRALELAGHLPKMIMGRSLVKFG
jgi:colicin import membrane protein